jgi:cytochrome oxidase Cu insertion factor (SCO1/SenC/PrrC family)/thiol-disulfide isomerase/thioredoxin
MAATLVLLALLVVLAVLARVHSTPSSASATVPAPLAVGTALQRPRPLPGVQLVDDRARSVPLSAWRGKWVVLAPSMTLCHEVCPMTTAALTDLTTKIRQSGLGGQVVVAEVTVDPWRDTPARLRAYRRLSGANFTLLTGAQSQIRRLWKFLGVDYQRVPQGKPPDVDWLTHKPETFDVAHTDGVFFLDPAGQERIADEGMPDVGGRLPVALRNLLSDVGQRNLGHPELPWTASELLNDLYFLMGRNIPASADPKLGTPSAAAAQRALAGSPGALASIHQQAGELLGSTGALVSRLDALRGYPIVLNAWASWCGPCQSEFSIFGSASAAYGRRAAFLGVSTNDSSGGARSFLAHHPVSYPSYQSSSAELARLAVVEGLPTTIFISASGRVVNVHAGQYDTLAALVNDIQRYAFGHHG